MTLPLVLITGGARSGKSRFALARTRRLGLPLVYLATAQPGDDEMAERIAAHRAERGAAWRTVEEPIEVVRALAAEPGRAVLLDCLTLWLSNLLLANADVAAAVDGLCAAFAERRCSLVCVTNEVGWGVVPGSRLGRAFRDEQGRLNQRVAELADEVHLLVAGQPLRIK